MKEFSLERVAKSPAVFDLEKLNWINGHYIRKAPLERLTKLALPFLQEAGYTNTNPEGEELKKVEKIISALKERIEYLAQIKEEAGIFFAQEVKPENEKAEEILQQKELPEVLEKFSTRLEELEDLEPASIKKMLKNITKELSLPGKKVFMPLRVALTGQMHGPDLPDIISILGKEGVRNRLDSLA